MKDKNKIEATCIGIHNDKFRVLEDNEVLLKIFESEFKDVQPIRSKDGKQFMCMTNETYDYIMKYKELYDHLNLVFNRDLLNILNDDLDNINYSEPIVEKFRVRNMLKRRLEK